MDASQPHQPPADQTPAQGQPRPIRAAPGPAAEPIAPPPAASSPPPEDRQPGESAELEALRLARGAHEAAGGLIARVDQLETKVVRVDRQLLILIGMVALVTYSIKSLAGKLEGVIADATPAPPAG
jgi:hypothetical protein